MEYIIGIILALLGMLGYNVVKRKSAEALLENIKTKEKLQDINKDVMKDEALLEREKQIRDDLQKNYKNSDTVKDITDYFNKKKRD